MSSNIKGIILCAGIGKRLYPVTKFISKTLIPVANKPTILYAIEALKEAGIQEIGIVITREQQEIQDLLRNGESLGVCIQYIFQNVPLGTGDALHQCADFINDSPFIVYLGDNIFGQSIKELIDIFNSIPADVYVTTKKVEKSNNYGVVKVENNIVTCLQEKPTLPISNDALTGLYLFNKGIINEFLHLPFSKNGEREMTMAIKNMLKEGKKVRSYEIKGWWVDMGTPQMLLLANKLVLNNFNQNDIDPEVIIKDSIIIPPVSIKSGCVISESVIGPYTSIAKNSIIKKSKINNCIVMNNVSLFNETFSNDIVIKNSYKLQDKVEHESALLIRGV